MIDGSSNPLKMAKLQEEKDHFLQLILFLKYAKDDNAVDIGRTKHFYNFYPDYMCLTPTYIHFVES